MRGSLSGVVGDGGGGGGTGGGRFRGGRADEFNDFFLFCFYPLPYHSLARSPPLSLSHSISFSRSLSLHRRRRRRRRRRCCRCRRTRSLRRRRALLPYQGVAAYSTTSTAPRRPRGGWGSACGANSGYKRPPRRAECRAVAGRGWADRAG